MKMRMLWILGTCLACAGILLGSINSAKAVNPGGSVLGSQQLIGGIVYTIDDPPPSLLLSRVNKIRNKYLEECVQLIDLDLYSPQVTGVFYRPEYEGILVNLPYDVEYIKRLRDDNTLNNSIASLVSSGTFSGDFVMHNAPLLSIVVDLGYTGSMKTEGKKNQGISCPSFHFDTVYLAEFAQSLCGGREDYTTGLTVNKLLDKLINVIGGKDLNEINSIFYSEAGACQVFGLPSKSVMMDFVYPYHKEKLGKIKTSEGVVLSVGVDANTLSIDYDTFRMFSSYLDLIMYGASNTFAAFYVQHVDGKDSTESLRSFFTVMELLVDHNYYGGYSTENPGHSSLSLFNSRKRKLDPPDEVDVLKHSPFIKTNVFRDISTSNPFNYLFETIWDEGLEPGSQLIKPGRDIPYKAGEGFGGFVLLLPFKNYYSGDL